MKKIFLAASAALISACTQIDTGNVGVESSLGQFKTEELPPGVYFTAFKNVVEISAKENVLPVENLRPKSQDNLTMADFDFDVYYRIDPSKAADLLMKYAGDLSEAAKDGGHALGAGLIFRQAREAAYRVAAQLPASDMHTKRTEISSEIGKIMQQELDKDAGKGSFVITNIIVRNVVTDPALEEAIKAAGKAQFEVRQKENQVAVAKAEAERRRVEAEGEARANRIIAESLTPQLIRLREIEATAKFATQGTHTVVLQGDAKPLISAK